MIEHVPPERHVKVLTPNTSACDFIWKYGHRRHSYNEVIGHTGVGCALIQSAGVLQGDVKTQREDPK